MNGDGWGRPLRVLYSHYLNDEEHPAARMVHAIAAELRGLGHEVKVHRCRGPVGHEPTDRSPAKRADPSLKARLRDATWFARALYKNRVMYRRDLEAIREFRPDVILGREDSYWCSTALAARKSGVPLVTFADVPVAYETRLFHNGERWHPPGVVEAVERFWLNQSREAVTVCRPGAEELRKLGVKTPIHVAWNGVDPSRFPEQAMEERIALRTALGLPTDKAIVGFQGSFRNFHGIDLLRDVMLATAGRSDAHWLLIGDGPERGPLQEAVAGKVEATFLGRRPPEEMGNLVAAFDVAVSSHMFISGAFYFCPLKILEYAASGCAIVASAQGDIPLLLDDGRAGVLLDDPCPEVWAKALHDLLDDPARARALGSAARARVLENFTWRRTAERIEAILLRAVDEPKAVASISPHYKGPVKQDREAGALRR